MELRHLRYFIAVAELENVSRAALKLHVSQPALSRQIHDLEDELGFSLLTRSAKSVQLTEAGRTFLTEARSVLQRVEEAVQQARTVARGGGEIHVGYAPSLTPRILPPTLRAFQAELPTVRVRLHDLSSEEMNAGLRQGLLKVAFMVRPTLAMRRGIEFEELSREAICLAVGPNHRLSTLRIVPLEEAAREPLVTYNRKEYPEAHEFLQATFGQVKRKLRILEEHDSVSSLIAAVEAGVGVAVVAAALSCTAGARLKLIPLSPAPAPLVVGIAWIKKSISAAGVQFIECARQAAQSVNQTKPSKAKN